MQCETIYFTFQSILFTKILFSKISFFQNFVSFYLISFIKLILKYFFFEKFCDEQCSFSDSELSQVHSAPTWPSLRAQALLGTRTGAPSGRVAGLGLAVSWPGPAMSQRACARPYALCREPCCPLAYAPARCDVLNPGGPLTTCQLAEYS